MLLVRSYLDTVQRAVILVATVKLAGFDAAVDIVIRFAFVKHIFTSMRIVGSPTQLVSAESTILCTFPAFFDMIN